MGNKSSTKAAPVAAPKAPMPVWVPNMVNNVTLDSLKDVDWEGEAKTHSPNYSYLDNRL
jgi:hypothetical protein